MKKIFGTREKLAIEYEIHSNSYSETNPKDLSWGTLKIWIKGNDICSYTHDDEESGYEYSLFKVINWIYENLEFIIGFDPYPVPVDGDNLLELFNETDKFESEDDIEFDLWYGAKSRWIFNHGWLNIRENEILTCLYIRRIDDNIEIAWDNDFWKEKKVFFKNPKGSFKIEYLEFRKILFQFLSSISKDIEESLCDDKIPKVWTQKMNIFGINH